jgi:hypothetical protein
MGKTMPYTSPDGAQHPNSFWCLSGLNVQIDTNRLELTFVGYHDTASYNADKQPVAGAVKSYSILGFNDFHGVIDRPILSSLLPIGGNILAMGWQVTLETKDDGIAPINEGVDTRTSFFEYAVDAPPPAPNNLIASVLSPTSVSLNWNPNTQLPNALLFESVNGGQFANLGQIGMVYSFTRTGLSPGSTYSFMVVNASLAGAISGFSNVATVMLPE